MNDRSAALTMQLNFYIFYRELQIVNLKKLVKRNGMQPPVATKGHNG
jgi:hypothetical protein